jgi:AraC-like DNA-binding protein
MESMAAGLVRSYLGDADPKNPLASPLYGDLIALPPIRVNVAAATNGFTFAETLRRAFARRLGVTPRQYRSSFGHAGVR